MESETTAPEGMRLHTIVAISKESLEDGKWWLEAQTDDGTVISLANFSEGVYEVIVDGPNEPHGSRSYRGGPGSPAHERFERFLSLYEEVRGKNATF